MMIEFMGSVLKIRIGKLEKRRRWLRPARVIEALITGKAIVTGHCAGAASKSGLAYSPGKATLAASTQRIAGR